ncbi:hypothetical protein [Apibacter mensalis]|uniref:hypothetical protein n=1 Tax=Apibacter mensalis TaxID=1586267 RepID=UPI0026EE3A55|nr:hypothetical protein [Apibacter mensalis]
MKSISKILILCYSIVLLISCSIREEITFNPEGNLTYSYLIDAGEFMKIMPDSLNKGIYKDTLISFNNLLTQKKDSISKLSLENQKKLEALKPLFIKVHQDEKKGEFYVLIYGDFTNSASLNSALAALNSIDNSKNNPFKNMEFLTNSTFHWNGNVFSKKSVKSESLKNDSVAQSILPLFTGGTFKTIYTFPKEIKKVNNSSAVISQDKKSLSMVFDASEYLAAPQKTDLKVELVK